MTAALSNAVTRADVAQVVVDEIGSALEASATALGIVLDDRQVVKLIAWEGYSDESVKPRLEVSLDDPTPGNRAVKRRVSAFYPSLDDVREAVPDVDEVMELAEHESFLYVPLVAGRRANGLLVLSWAEPYRLATEDRRFVETLAGQAAQALDRASALRVRADDRRDASAQRPSRVAAARRRRSARRSLPSGNRRRQRRRRLVRRHPAVGRAARAWSSGTSSARASRQPRRWPSSGTRCGRSPWTG